MRKPDMLKLCISFTSLFLAIIACNQPQNSATVNIASIVAQTQTAIAVQQLLTTTPIPENTPIPITASVTPTTLEITSTLGLLTPTASNVREDCINLAKFETETIPDGTPVGPGQEFIKTWTLRNVGDCTWTPEYALVFIEGEQMGGFSPTPIGQTIPPNGTIQIYLPQTAPVLPGEYQGYWKIRSYNGQEFGISDNGEKPFWVKILVQPGAIAPASPLPGIGTTNPAVPPDWSTTFDSVNTPFSLGPDEYISFDVYYGDLVMTALKQAGDLWRVAEAGIWSDFLLEVQFQTGASCTGKDSYGLIVRAPSQPDNIIDSGYVIGISCDGNYRVYRMDNGNYTGIQNWIATSAIKAGGNQVNIIKINAIGNRLQIFANETMLYELIDGTYTAGLFGLLVRSEQTSNFQVRVKQISAWRSR